MSDADADSITPAPADDGAALPALPAAGAWRRFLARLFDMWWQIVLLGLIVGVVLAMLGPRAVTWVLAPAGSLLLGMLLVLLGFVLDAALLARFASTPGKYLLGVRVQTVGGQPPSWRAALRRNLGVWSAGMGLAIPLLNLILMARQGWRVGEGRPATYDEGRFQVLALPIGWRRRLGFMLAALALLVAIGTLGDKPRDPATPAGAARAPGAPISWTNPETGNLVTIAPGWRHDMVFSDDGQPRHRFVRDGGRVAVMLSSEAVGPTPLTVFVRAVIEDMAAQVKLEGRYETFLGSPSWAAENFLDDADVTRIEVRVLQRGGVYWRMTSAQEYPYRDTDAALGALREQLWSTLDAR